MTIRTLLLASAAALLLVGCEEATRQGLWATLMAAGDVALAPLGLSLSALLKAWGVTTGTQMIATKRGREASATMAKVFGSSDVGLVDGLKAARTVAFGVHTPKKITLAAKMGAP